MLWGFRRPFPFNFNFIVYFSKHQNVLEYSVTEQKAELPLKITLETLTLLPDIFTQSLTFQCLTKVNIKKTVDERNIHDQNIYLKARSIRAN